MLMFMKRKINLDLLHNSAHSVALLLDGTQSSKTKKVVLLCKAMKLELLTCKHELYDTNNMLISLHFTKTN